MKPLKYIIYLLAAIAAPLWIFLDKYNESHTPKNPLALDSTSAKNLLNAIVGASNNKMPIVLSSQLIINGSHLDSLFMFLSKATVGNNSHINTLNDQLQASIKSLTDISISNSQTIQGLLSKDRNINVNVSGAIPINISTKNDSTISKKENEIPIYELNSNGPYEYWKIKLGSEQLNQDQKYFLVIYNTSLTDTAYVDSIKTVNDTALAKSSDSSDFLYFEKIILPQSQILIQFKFSNFYNKLYYIIGHYNIPKKRSNFLTRKDQRLGKDFKIPLIVGKSSYP